MAYLSFLCVSRYRDKLLDLLCVPSVQALERKVVRLITRAEEEGASLEEVFRYFDKNKDGLISTQEMEDGLRRVHGIGVRDIGTGSEVCGGLAS